MLKVAHPTLQLVRGFGGAVLFSFPMLMTLEMWSLGVSIKPWRLMLFIAVHLLLLVERMNAHSSALLAGVTQRTISYGRRARSLAN